jgi:UDP-N-acetylglucosamine--dolichyl-phosphate N-acetylglucosaminephosphotransferase
MFRPDMNKTLGRRNVPALGGIASIGSFMTAISIFVIIIIFRTPMFQINYLLLSLLSLSLIAFIGVIDDVLLFPFRLLKPVLVLFACIPLMAANFPNNLIMHIPLLGQINLGIWYAFAFIPLIIIFTSNSVNILAGLDGLVPGLTSVMTAALWIVSFMKGNMIAIIYFTILLATQLVLFFYNKPPSKVFPGNIGTLFAGGAIAIGAIIANAERALIILLIPYAIHFVFYCRNFFRFTPREMGVLKRDGTLKCPYEKCYGLTHVLMKYLKKPTETRIVWYLVLFEIIMAISVVLAEYFNIMFL